MWSRDTLSEFNVLLQQITSGALVAASGISSWTLDIGGFTGLDIDTEYARAARKMVGYWHFPSLFRVSATSHHLQHLPLLTTANEPWSYGEQNFEIIKQYISLRYQLVPYLKTLFGMLQATGRSIMCPLYYDFSPSVPFIAQATGYDPLVVHQSMLGAERGPGRWQGATSKEVYLPGLPASMQGMTWTRWWTDVDYGQGDQTVNVSATLDPIPVFYLGKKSDIFSDNV